MKELKLYQCEICDTQYTSKILAEDCEKSHKVPKKIIGCRYLSKKQNQSGYPQKISVMFDDGETIDYHV